nr:hypothetical protein [Luteimonas sp. BDR2-5]
MHGSATGGDAGDAALRALYRDAQTHISGGTMARLHQARHAASQNASAPRRRWTWPVAASFAALFALAVGMQVVAPPGPETGTAPAPDVIASVDALLPDPDGFDDAVDDAVAAYDESPDFYLWLASNEATLLALE